MGSTAPDLRGLHQSLGERIDGEVRGLHISGKAVGIGLPAAASGSAKRVFMLQPRAVVMVGTCGVYPGLEGYQPLDVIVASRVTLVDHVVDADRAAFPNPMSTRVDTHAALSAGLAATSSRAHLVPVASPLASTRDDRLAAGIPTAHECHVENLEAFAVGSTCRLARVPYGVVLCITHVVGSYGDGDWKKFQRDATLVAARTLLDWAHAGAPGLPHGQ